MTPASARLVFVALGAGLMTGLSRFLAPVLVVAIAVALCVALRRVLALVLPVAFLVGVALAHLALSRDRATCAARLPEGPVRIALRLIEPVIEGTARAVQAGGACHGWLRVRLPDGVVPPVGSRVEVEGRWLPRRSALRPVRGVLVGRQARLEAGPPDPTPSDRLRALVSLRSERLYGPRAGVVDALILGRREGMAPALGEAFARAGLIHILAISGFHVGLVASWTVLLALACGAKRPNAWVIGAGVSVAYVALLGWPAPATRAAGLSALAALGIVRQRASSRMALLAAACFGVLIVDPWAVFDLGAWLSALSIVGLHHATRWSDRALAPTWGWRMLAASIGSTLATAPLTAAVLGTVAPIGIALNFAAIPIAAVAVPGVLASLLADLLVPPLGPPLAAGTGLVLAALEELATAGARVPGGHVITEPGWRAALPWVLLLICVAWGIRGGARLPVAGARWAGVAALAMWGLVLAAALRQRAHGDEGLTLHFLDVGQGDAAAVRTPAGRWVLIDAGPADGRLDAGRRVVAPFLARQGVRQLEAAFVSHAHNDHLGGLPEVLRRVPARVVLEPGMPSPEEGYLGFLDWMAATGQRWTVARAGSGWTIDGVRFAVVHPDTTWGWWGLDLNENSLVLVVEWMGFRALLTGDAGLPAESLLAGQVGRVDLLKVGHHGSRGSTGERFLADLAPRVAVMSLGRRNRHGHPAPETLARLATAGATVFRTDRDGAIRVTVAAGQMTVSGASRAITLPLRR